MALVVGKPLTSVELSFVMFVLLDPLCRLLWTWSHTPHEAAVVDTVQASQKFTFH